jgi:hypothetical protein
MSSLFLAAGVPVNFPTADIFTPVIKELAGVRLALFTWSHVILQRSKQSQRGAVAGGRRS